MSKKYSTTYLLGENNFLIGMACALNLGGNFFLYGDSESSLEADIKALENDWGIIGQDIQEAINNYEHKQ